MNYAIILAGGTGTRFWPLSRQMEPKQFLNVCSRKPMIEETIQRLDRLVKRDNIYLATNKAHEQKIKGCMKLLKLPFKNIFFEPQGRNTLAPIGFLSSRINALDKEAVVVVLPCDHIVKQSRIFLNLLKKGIDIAGQGYIVTLGIPPTRPETGYGYIKTGAKSKGQNEGVFYKVDKYIEKPNLLKAKKLIRDKRYYWNSGIFIFKPQVMLEEIRKFQPGTYEIIKKIKSGGAIKKLWSKLLNISVDYGIMEKTKKMALLPAHYGWKDIGSWQAVEETLKKDKNGNILVGNCISLESKNNLVWSDNRLVATLGLEDLIIVNTSDALLVCAKNKAQEVKKIVQILKQKNIKGQI
ncbi:MAG: mannose-1-phosphate guanylyltransferase [Candidatus Omnitrophica bacterium]|nr:mannose-1-phosphate guanylyltransferase [Candidatus Omnitrophota bacterium]